MLQEVNTKNTERSNISEVIFFIGFVFLQMYEKKDCRIEAPPFQ